MRGMHVTREEIVEKLAESGYVADRALATSLHVMQLIGRPLLVEGEAGVGKTEIAKALASTLDTRLIRMQCYEGLDQSTALYEWNYQRQLLAIELQKSNSGQPQDLEAELFSERYLLERPLLAAIRQNKPPVLLIDEIDRADEEFEAFLLELLSDFQVTIPELGTIKATSVPHVILTSNGTRELSDALRRRCLYHYLDFPDAGRETQIILTRLPELSAQLAGQIARTVAQIRKENLSKIPGVAETLDWTAALAGLDISSLEGNLERVHETLLCILKTNEDRQRISPEVSARIIGRAA